MNKKGRQLFFGEVRSAKTNFWSAKVVKIADEQKRSLGLPSLWETGAPKTIAPGSRKPSLRHCIFQTKLMA